MNAASQGDTALANSDFVNAIQHYTRALVELPRAPAYYIKRSTAYTRLKPGDGGPDILGALQDAEIAVVLARERAKRDLILSAQMRRAVALYQLGRYGDAGFLFGLLEAKVSSGAGAGAGGAGAGAGGDAGDKVKEVMKGAGGAGQTKGVAQELPIWLIKVKGKLAKLEEGDEARTVTVGEVPEGVKVPTEKELKLQLESLRAGKIVGVGGGQVQTSATGQEAKRELDEASAGASDEKNTPGTAPAVPEKIRHEWYQSNDSVVVTLYAKGVPKESVDVELKGDSVSVQFPLPSGSEYAFTLDPLFAAIDKSSSKVTTGTTKIELMLRKKTPGQKWSSLEASSTDIKLPDRQSTTVPSSSAPSSTPVTTITTATTSASAPAYPTSSRHGAKDWDKLASNLIAKKPKPKPKSKPSSSKDKSKEPPADESDSESDNEGSVDSDFGGDPVDGFFKKLYANADDDTRRAMVKSFVESQGTSLSTNWNEVSQGKVKSHPPSD
ncbi:hypothetical protein P175DRAFT_0479539 [Aspergillus ochraceoroseus IBT 24754]|uniref:CS domain-containing protein n=1 Tax=Aspergillus ochraceoroseus IBT 24754 TaxID=1392256 RepID=A0A2T5LXH4_9EURO|nr:uncharacterized protein P175DRAFT_0479539 [Aspergillus ochraceoroseus IBT 24754]PTU20992.1 hypothetical protein P175DRAFT_0479539 [Aspergillus ochraceoroseus IBT 24754]